jgi:NADH:ubiquinone oxidoreductase subunit 6 (subunit J)
VISVLFLVISTLGLLAALGTVLARNLVHAALYLVAFFFIIACQFVLLEAEFLAAIQVLIYIGAVAILMMFAIMLTRNILGDDASAVPVGWKVPGFLAGLGLFAVLVFGINRHEGAPNRPSWSSMTKRPVASTDTPEGAALQGAINNMGKAVGDDLLTRYVIPFEVAGLLLTAALVGAIAVAHREGDDHSPRLGAIETVTAGTTEGSDLNGPDRGASKPEALSSLSS